MFKVLGKGVITGLILVILTVVLLPLFLGDSLIKAESNKKESEEEKSGFSQLMKVKMAEGEELVDRNFSIEIDKIELKTKIIANVETNNKEAYLKALKKGVAHAKGTYLPGMEGGVTLFDHSIDVDEAALEYGASFYRLDELEKGDKIRVWFEGEEYQYEVYRAWVTYASDTGVFQRIKNGERLFLVTCTPPGGTDKRLIVEALALTE